MPYPREEEERECVQCGNAFVMFHPRKHTCGGECSKIWNREWSRMRYTRHREEARASGPERPEEEK